MDKPNIFLVGGAVRDMILQQEPTDKDYVAVGYKATDFAHLPQVGKSFPVFLQEDGSELALARTERKVGSGYNGFTVDVENVTLEEDLARRDLTINSIAYDEASARFIDPFGGREDIRNKVLRHTTKAFSEDPLRVLRLARFRARFGVQWKIHSSTKVLVYSMRDELGSLEPNRVFKEVEKVLLDANARLFFETLFELGVLDIIFPSIYALTTLKEGSKWHEEGSLFIHTMMVLEALEGKSLLLQCTALYHDIAKVHCYRTQGNAAGHESIALVEPLIDIDLPKKLKKNMLFLISKHTMIGKLGEMRASKIATFFESFKKNRELFDALVQFYDADAIGRITQEPKPELAKEKLRITFDAIASYSPKAWIDAQGDVSAEAIQEHIHIYNISCVQNYLLN